MTGRAQRLQSPRVPSRFWKVARIAAVAILAPVLLFLLFLFVLRG
jgi:hypothetical protein